jgi:Icc-related predicted phosphoesterase
LPFPLLIVRIKLFISLCMIIIAISDIHGHLTGIERISDELEKADLVILTGDITHFGKRNDAEQVIKAISRYTRSVFTIPGNCDSAEVFQYLAENKISLHGNAFMYNGLAFIGLGGSLPCPGNTPGEFNEKQINEILIGALKAVDADSPYILVSHQPPCNTRNDRVANGGHVGSMAVRSFIEEYQPLICFTGHIHEGVGIDWIKNTPIVNPGPLREGGYTYLEINAQRYCLEVRGRRVE